MENQQLPAQLKGPRPGGQAVGSIVCLLPPPPGKHRVSRSRLAAGTWQKLGSCSPTQAHPDPHVLAWACSHPGIGLYMDHDHKGL